jgi:hypothetical protein
MSEKITSFLERFAHLEPDEQKIKKSVQSFIMDQCNLEVGLESISIKKKMIYLELHPILKQNVLKRKKELLAALAGESWYFTHVQ